MASIPQVDSVNPATNLTSHFFARPRRPLPPQFQGWGARPRAGPKSIKNRRRSLAANIEIWGRGREANQNECEVKFVAGLTESIWGGSIPQGLSEQLGHHSGSNGMCSSSPQDNTGQTKRPFVGLGPGYQETDLVKNRFVHSSALCVHIRSCAPSVNERAARTHAELHALCE